MSTSPTVSLEGLSATEVTALLDAKPELKQEVFALLKTELEPPKQKLHRDSFRALQQYISLHYRVSLPKCYEWILYEEIQKDFGNLPNYPTPNGELFLGLPDYVRADSPDPKNPVRILEAPGAQKKSGQSKHWTPGFTRFYAELEKLMDARVAKVGVKRARAS